MLNKNESGQTIQRRVRSKNNWQQGAKKTNLSRVNGFSNDPINLKQVTEKKKKKWQKK